MYRDRVSSRGGVSRRPGGARRALGGLGAIALVIVGLLRQSRRRRAKHDQGDKGPAHARSSGLPIPKVPTMPVTRRWPAVAASTAAFTGYLALLGGVLLAIRFWHAGLPVTQAVSSVPVSTLVTTALIEIFVPLLAYIGVLIIAALSGLPAAITATKNGRTAPERDNFNKWFDRIAKPLAALAVLGLLPFNIWGITFGLGMMVILFAGAWTPPLHRLPTLSATRATFVSIAILLAAASIPVLARQGVEPLNMERVTIDRPSEPPLIADLVAIRDTSIVVGRCHE